jgi:hypothetical protein
MSPLLRPAIFLAAGLFVLWVLALPLAAQAKPSFSSLTITGSQPYNLTCSVTGVQFSESTGPSGAVTFTDVTAGVTLNAATLGTPSNSNYKLPQQNWPAGVIPSALASGDFNGDGNLDLVVGGVGTIATVLGNANGSFQPPILTSLGNQAAYNVTDIAVGDFDGDKLLDIVEFSHTTLYFMKGNGDGTFHAPLSVDTGGLVPNFIVAGDFRGNGMLDIAFAVPDQNQSGGSSQNVAILLGNGNGSFQAPQTFAAIDNPANIIAADFNNDKHLDLAVTGTAGTAILLGTGTGSFNPAITYSNAPGNWLGAGDFDEDGAVDLAVSNGNWNVVSTTTFSRMKGNNDGTFQPPVTIASSTISGNMHSGYIFPDGFTDIVATDLNGDGHLDLAVSDYTNYLIHVFLGDGKGDFQASQDLSPAAAAVWAPLLVDGPFVSLGQQLVATPGSASVSIFAVPAVNQLTASATISNVAIPAVLPTTHNLQCSYAGDLNYSSSVSVEQPVTLPTAATPVIQPPTGMYVTPFQATISDTTPGVTIYYTTDGTTPTTSSPQYTGPITVNGSETVTAIASSAAFLTSATVSATYTAATITGAPIISPAAGTYKQSSPNLQVTISGPSGATIYYTTDGTTPTINSTRYTAPFSVTGNISPDGVTTLGVAVVQAIAVALGQIPSTVASAVYRINTTWSQALLQTYDSPSPLLCNVTGLSAFSPSGPSGNVTFTDLTAGQSIATLPSKLYSTFPQLAVYSVNPVAAGGAAYFATGDFNGDGKTDLAVSTNAGISVLLGNGDGTFQNAMLLAGTGLGQMVVGDINGDNKPDLIIISGSGFSTMLGNGDGTLQAPVFHDLGSAATNSISGGNFGNGNFDLAFGTGSSVVVVLGNGNGTFQSGFTYAAGNGASLVIAADFTGDTKLDLAVANRYDNTISVLPGNGDGTFQSQMVSALGFEPFTLVAADFNRDGHIDLASDNYVLLGNGDGTFQYSSNLIFTTLPIGVLVTGDFNKDGIPDLASVGGPSGPGTYIFRGKGDGTFTQEPFVNAISRISGFFNSYAVTADFNGDGYSDLAFAGNDNSGNTYAQAAIATPTNIAQATLADFWISQDTSPLSRSYSCSYGGDSSYQGSMSPALNYTFRTLGPVQFSLLVGVYNAPQTVTISADPGATIYYTTDGSTPTITSTQYKPGTSIPVTTTTTFKAIAVEAGYQITPVSEAVYTFASTPQFSLPSSTYTPGQSVSITDSTPNSSIYYTTDGSTPTVRSARYTAPVQLSGSLTLKAMAIAPNYLNSAVASATYTPPASKTVLIVSPVSVKTNQVVTFTVTVTGSSPTGSVILSTGSTKLNKANLTNGIATLPGSFATAGTYPITASYSGDANNAASTSSAVTLTVTPPVSPPSTKTVLTVSPVSVNTNQVVTFTVTVTGSSPTGSVILSTGSTKLNKANLTNGIATLQGSFASAGTYPITASYSGDANNAPSDPSAVTLTVTPPISPPSTKTALTISTVSVNTNQAVTFTATVTGSSPTGSVTFTAGSTKLNTVNLTNGIATMQTSFTTAGTYPITASYSGDANNAPSDSSAVTLTVTPPVSPSYTVSSNPTTQTITAGQSATFTITVTPAGSYSSSTSFACSALPSKATCSFSPSTVTPSGGPASSTLTISTTASSSAANRMPASWFPTGGLVFAGLFGLMLRPRRALRWLPCLLLLWAALLSVSACGGGSGSGSEPGGNSNPSTPAGTYSVSVDVSGSGAANQNLPVQLIVQ